MSQRTPDARDPATDSSVGGMVLSTRRHSRGYCKPTSRKSVPRRLHKTSPSLTMFSPQRTGKWPSQLPVLPLLATLSGLSVSRSSCGHGPNEIRNWWVLRPYARIGNAILKTAMTSVLGAAPKTSLDPYLPFARSVRCEELRRNSGLQMA